MAIPGHRRRGWRYMAWSPYNPPSHCSAPTPVLWPHHNERGRRASESQDAKACKAQNRKTLESEFERFLAAYRSGLLMRLRSRLRRYKARAAA